MHPRHRASRAKRARSPALLGFEASLRQHIHVLLRDRGDPRRDPAGFSLKACDARRVEGGPRASAEQERSESVSAVALDLALGSRDDAASAWRKSPLGGREGSRPVRCQTKDGLSANLGMRSRTCRAWPGKRGIGVDFFCLLFFGHPKKSRARTAGERKLWL